MPNIKMFSLEDGREYDVTASSGTSLMKAAVNNDVPGVVGECGGELSCATCHVIVDAAWPDLATGRSDEEEDLLEMVDGATPHSRLSCQIRLTDDLDGLAVTVPHA